MDRFFNSLGVWFYAEYRENPAIPAFDAWIEQYRQDHPPIDPEKLEDILQNGRMMHLYRDNGRLILASPPFDTGYVIPVDDVANAPVIINEREPFDG